MDFSLPSAFAGAILVFVGGIIASLLNKHAKNRELKCHLYDLKLKIFSELLDAYYKVAKNSSDKLLYVLCYRKVQLIASEEVSSISEEFFNTDKLELHPKILNRLVSAMRKDLGKF